MDKPCSCTAMYRHDWSSIHEHCKRYFIPVGWGYCETPKHGIRPSLILQGRCKACGGSIEIGYPVPAACEDDGERYHFLFRQLQTWRPYADLSENVLPAAAERLAWYEEQEERTTDGWAQLLLDLLPEAEAPYARLWLSGYRKRQEEQWRGAWPIGSVARFKQEAPIHVTPYIGYGQGRDITARPMQEMKVVNVHACPEGVIYSGLIKVERETFYIEEVKDALLYSQEEWEALLPELEAEPSPLLFRSSFKAQLPPQPVERYYVLAEECGFFGEKKELHLLAASASVDLLKDQISREIARLTTADLLSVGAAFMPLEVESPESEDYSYRYIEIGGSLTYYISPVPVLAMEAISPREQGSGAEGHIS